MKHYNIRNGQPTAVTALVFWSIVTLFVAQALVRAAMPPMLQDAETAYVKGDFAQAQKLYTKALEDPKLDSKFSGEIKAKIAICQINLEAAVAGTQPTTPPPSPRTAHAKPRPNEVRTMDIKELGNFDYDPDRGGGVPADVTALTGLHVRLTGYMIPLTQANDSITEFALVPSLLSCCFGQPPQLQHTIMVHCSAKSPAAFYTDLITVDGILKVQEKREDNYTVSLFDVDALGVKPAEVKIPMPSVSK